MRKQTTLLAIDQARVSVFSGDGRCADLEIPPDKNSDEDVAGLLHQFLQENGCLGDRLVWGISSREVYFLKTDFDRVTTQNPDAVKFAVETLVPVDAEDMAVVIVGSAAKTQQTLVWDLRKARKLLVLLNEQHGVSFSGFVPKELVWIQHLQNQGKSLADQQIVAKVSEHSWERFQLDGEVLLSWEYVSSSNPNLSQCQTIVAEGTAGKTVSIEILQDKAVLKYNEVMSDALSHVSDVESLRFNFSESLDSSITNNQSPWQAVLLTSLFIFMGIAVALWYRSTELDRQSTQAQAASVAIFRDLFPNRRIKTGVHKQLETELKREKRVSQLSGHADTSLTLLANLRDMLKATQSVAPMRYQFDSLTLGTESITIEGRVKDFVDFQKLKGAFTEQGFSIVSGTRNGDPFTLILAMSRSDSNKAPSNVNGGK